MMKNKLDKHIDTKLKASFDAFQKKVPDHLWEQISQEMNVEDALNDSLDEKVQAAQLSVPIQKAPEGMWSKIEGLLEETSPTDAILDQKVKDGFLSETKSAPTFLWGAISTELSSPSASVDAALDDKLKQGFLTQEIKKTPHKVWYAVSRQLNIDKTWERISKVLDKEPVVSDWSGRMLRFLTGAAILLLLLKTCTNEPSVFPKPNLAQQVDNSSNASKDLGKAPVSTLGNGVDALSENVKQEHSLPKSSESANSKYKKASEIKNKTLKEEFPTSLLSTSSKKGRIGATKGSSKNTLALIEGDATTDSKTKSTIVASSEALENTSSPLITKSDKEPIGEGIETLNQEKKNLLSETKEESSLTLLNTLVLDPLVVDNGVEPIQLLEEMQLERKKKVQKNWIEGKLEAGAFAVVNSTMLLNNETREGFDQNSLTTNYFGLAANYGLWASYRILPRGALVAEFSINADNRQAYGVYEKGVFYIKEWVMKYNRFSLAYKHDLWQSNTNKLVQTKVVAQAGIYVGMMREAKLFYDGVLFFDKQSDYHQFDFGFKVALGQEILIDKFVLGYGIRSDIGASNIFRGNNQLNAREDQTNIIHLGGYVLFGYRF